MNEVYGRVIFDVSTKTSGNEAMSFLEAGYKLNTYKLANARLVDENGQAIDMEIHNVEVELEKWFSEDE